MYTVEFQKRGLPHAHILLWLDGKSKLKTPADIDNVISVEFPNQELYPKLHKVVSNYMIHGSCGPAQFDSPCMKEGRYSKYYPKNFTSCTTIDEEGYSSYRRHDNGSFVEKKWNPDGKFQCGSLQSTSFNKVSSSCQYRVL